MATADDSTEACPNCNYLKEREAACPKCGCRPLDEYVWQAQEECDWYVFGRLVRGVVRDSLAEIYWDEEQSDEGGWVWLTLPNTPFSGQPPLGQEVKFVWAVEAAEKAILENPKLFEGR